MSAAHPLKGRHRWLTNPATAAVMASLGVVVIYASAMLSFPEGSLTSFIGAVIGVTVGLNFVADAIEQRRLRTLRGLGDGSLRPSQANLALAATEVARAADFSSVLSISFLALGSFLVGVVWWQWSHVDPSLALRAGFLGASMGPLAAVTANLVTLPRARVVLRELVHAGLSVDSFAQAVPQRSELRGRLALFFFVAAATPLVLVLDMAFTRTQRLLQRMAEAPTAPLARAVYEADHLTGLAPLLGVGSIIVAYVLVCSYLAGRALGQPLAELAKETERLAGGHYGNAALVPSEYETLAAAASLAGMEQQLVEALSRLRAASTGVSAATVDLVASGQLQLAGADEQSSALAATTATTEELARSARQIAANARTVSEIARQTLTAARSGKDSADSFTGAMRQVREGNQAIADSVVKLNKRVQQVGRVIEFIDGIADRSDLLALNAELEGNKAGEVGLGFSLVAAEMRRLSESVMTSTQQIAGLIEEIRDATNAAVMATEAGVKATEAGGSLAQKMSDELSHIFDFANLTSDAMQSIGTSTAQQQAGTDQLASAMAEILRSTESGSAISRQLSDETQQLERLAKELEGSLERLDAKGAPQPTTGERSDP